MSTNGLVSEEIGNRIQLARKEAEGMTQEELGHLVGVTSRSVAAWEAGDVVPFKYLRKLSDYLNRSPAWILYGEDARTASPDALDEITQKLDQILEMLSRTSEADASMKPRGRKQT